jgi:hypothetical protein
MADRPATTGNTTKSMRLLQIEQQCQCYAQQAGKPRRVMEADAHEWIMSKVGSLPLHGIDWCEASA